MTHIDTFLKKDGIKNDAQALVFIFQCIYSGCGRSVLLEKLPELQVGWRLRSANAHLKGKMVSEDEIKIFKELAERQLLAVISCDNAQEKFFVSLPDNAIVGIIQNFPFLTKIADDFKAMERKSSIKDYQILKNEIKNTEDILLAQSSLPPKYGYTGIAVEMHKLFLDINTAKNHIKKDKKGQSDLSLAKLYFGKIFLYDSFAGPNNRFGGNPKLKMMVDFPHANIPGHGMALSMINKKLTLDNWLAQNLMGYDEEYYSIKDLIFYVRNTYAAHSFPYDPERKKLEKLHGLSFGNVSSLHFLIRCLGLYVANLLKIVRCCEEFALKSENNTRS